MKKSIHDVVLCGVLAGIAEHNNHDPFLYRFIFIMLLLAGLDFLVIGYILAIFLMK